MSEFRVAVSHDLPEIEKRTGLDVGLTALRESGLPFDILDDFGAVLPPNSLSGYNALLLVRPRITAQSLLGADRLSIIARWGVGFDNVDIEACSARGIAVAITPDAVRRPMAVAILAMLLALSTNLVQKDRLLREGEWDQEAYVGMGLTGRTMGLIGLGNIGTDLLHLIDPLDMRHLAYDPYAAHGATEGLDVEFTDFETLLEVSDFICVCCPLTAETRHLIDATALSKMKPTASILNAARGPIIDEVALVEALETESIRAAALDVFEQEPLAEDSPLRALDNVVLTPHSVGWSDEIFLNNGRSAVSSIVSVVNGTVPRNLVNREVLSED